MTEPGMVVAAVAALDPLPKRYPFNPAEGREVRPVSDVMSEFVPLPA